MQPCLAFGCAVVHTETAAETADNPNPSYRNMLRTGFEPLYLRRNYTHTTAGAD